LAATKLLLTKSSLFLPDFGSLLISNLVSCLLGDNLNMQKRYSDLSRNCRIYVSIIWTSSAIFLLVAIIKVPIPNHELINFTELLFWAALVILSESFLIYLPLSGYLSIGTAIDIPIILMFGPTLAAFYGMLAAISTLIVRRVPFYRILFNISLFVLTMGISSLVYHSLASGVDFAKAPQFIPVFILTIVVYFGLNSSLLSIVIGLSEGLSPRVIWMKNHSWTIGYLFVLASIGYLMVMVNFALGKWAIVLLLLPVLLIRKAYSQYMDLKKMQDQLIQSERLAAVGQMAAGISHELDNPISIIMGNSDYLLKKMTHDDSSVEEIKIIRKETERCKAIIKEFLDFAKPRTTVETIDVSKAVRNAISLLRRESLSRNVKVAFDEDTVLPGIKGDMKQLEQVFINIMLNAFQAMPKGGRLEISTGLTKDPQRKQRLLISKMWKKESQDKVVQVTFQDTGSGITKENIEQLFMPFFTTKSKEGGRGLGLFVCYQIVKKHGGSFDIQSELGKGTSVTINLPLSRGNQR
jgi:signal transduction histidine kinase